MPSERVIVLQIPEWEEETRDFTHLLAQLTELVPQIETLRPGLVAMRARGPARYYGGEAEAATALLQVAHAAGSIEARVGIADSRFAALQAAALHVSDLGGNALTIPDPSSDVRIIEPGRSASFLSRLPVSSGVDERLGALLPGLGIYTLGAFAALPEDAVRARFGPAGVLAHRHARGLDAEHGEEIRPQQPTSNLDTELHFEPPLTSTEQLAFACSPLAEQLYASLSEEHLVCTTLRITLTDDIEVKHEREWTHPRFFTPSDIVARIRWQAGSLESGTGERTGAGVAVVHLSPIRIDRAASHEPGLWTSGPDERIHHHLSRAQGLLGPSGVGTTVLAGGRLLRDRQLFVPWGVAAHGARPPGPWPGSLPFSQPSLVFSSPLRAQLLGAAGTTIGIDEDDLLTENPHSLSVEHSKIPGQVQSWSKPWPIRERWWEGRPDRFRLQVELTGGTAWLLLGQTRDTLIHWFAEGQYD
ncbi:DNA polymerase Y family protein [Leucobacter denitrificans]|uniref:DNA polymerase Y family protein n=1 Tax=Leucobacter denitrificans TaxID=683042 RepID=A0A7G9S4X9_9MICO|nr:DNA polymerase Y family protein [Leucobacter denitrificans]QNN62904.1 DNA polymerase Y family protein [Leucobacter denitrificans]